MGKQKRVLILFLLILLFVGSLLTVFYPLISSWYSEQNRSEIVTSYEEMLQDKGEDEISAAVLAALEYNKRLAEGEFLPVEYKENGYFDLLNLSNQGIMGFVEIPKIDINLPIYHGTGTEALSQGAGHMEQTSLPVGGASSHAVLSAHTGMASQAMFTDLVLLDKGDLFYLTVMGEKMAYEVDQIKVVLPYEIDDIQIIEGEDLVTLSTCHPYGSNTHRLLVRGHRIELEEAATIVVKTEEQLVITDTSSIWMDNYYKGIGCGVAIAVSLIFLVIMIFVVRKKIVAAKQNDKVAESSLPED